MPFDRLVRSVDEWAGAHGRHDVIAQIGPSSYKPQYIEHSQFIDPIGFRRNIEQADAIVAHAGMGSIISAVELGKPILVMPRRGDLGETRNDHQIATAERFSSLRLVEVAADEHELRHKLDEIDHMIVGERACKHAKEQWTACPFAHDDLESCGVAHKQACSHLLKALNAFFSGRSPFEIMLPIEVLAESPVEQQEPVEMSI